MFQRRIDLDSTDERKKASNYTRGGVFLTRPSFLLNMLLPNLVAQAHSLDEETHGLTEKQHVFRI